MNILILTMGYPSKRNPRRLVFLQRLVEKLIDQGDTCTVISPVKFPTENTIKPVKQEYITENGNSYYVYFPRYLCFWLSSRIQYDPIKNISTKNYIECVKGIIKKESIKFDIVYSHFLGLSAECAVSIKKLYDKPCFAAAGESTFDDFEGFDRKYTISYLNYLDGIISVSTENKEILLKNQVLSDDKICVIPNGVDRKVFYPRDRQEARQHFGFDSDSFICAFVGHFIERKGPLRVLEAISNTDVKGAFVGSGEQKPTGDNVIWNDPLSPSEIPLLLSAADVFVLPTLNEGCCNAIIEAMACGLPIVSSDRQFNDDILNEKNSIRINPESVEGIQTAILQLEKSPMLLEELRQGAVKKAEELDLNNRAIRIRKWINNNIMH